MGSQGNAPRVINASLDAALDRAIESHIKGDIDYVRYVCQRILEVDPKNAVARHHLKLVDDWRSLSAMLRNLVAPRIGPAPDVIFDVGANTGITVKAYREAFPEAVIHAFEPDPELVGSLRDEHGSDRRVVVNPVALGAEPGTAAFNINRAGGNNGIGSFLALNPDNEVVRNLVAEQVRRIDVPVTTIDRYCEDAGIARIDFLKLDVQGFEDQCLKGAGAMLARGAIGLIQVELLLSDMYERTLSFLDIESVLAPYGYRLFAIDDVYPRLGAELFQLDAFYVPSAPRPTSGVP